MDSTHSESLYCSISASLPPSCWDCPHHSPAPSASLGAPFLTESNRLRDATKRLELPLLFVLHFSPLSFNSPLRPVPLQALYPQPSTCLRTAFQVSVPSSTPHPLRASRLPASSCQVLEAQETQAGSLSSGKSSGRLPEATMTAQGREASRKRGMLGFKITRAWSGGRRQ